MKTRASIVNSHIGHVMTSERGDFLVAQLSTGGPVQHFRGDDACERAAAWLASLGAAVVVNPFPKRPS